MQPPHYPRDGHVRSRSIPLNYQENSRFLRIAYRGRLEGLKPAFRSQQTIPVSPRPIPVGTRQNVMPSLTDTAIRHALKRVELSQKQENLADVEGRGTGRLVLVLKPGGRSLLRSAFLQRIAMSGPRTGRTTSTASSKCCTPKGLTRAFPMPMHDLALNRDDRGMHDY